MTHSNLAGAPTRVAHFALKKLVYQFANLLAILLREILKLFLKFCVEIYRQPQLRTLAVKFSSYAFGKIVITLHDYFLLYCLADSWSYFRGSRDGARCIFCAAIFKTSRTC